MTAATAQADRRRVEALVCVQTHTRLVYLPDRQELVSKAAGVAYPIRDGIPVLLLDEARPLA